MKVVVRCANCNQIKRRSDCYHVRLLGKINNGTILQKPDWQDWEEKVWLCKPCAGKAGYKIYRSKKNDKKN